MQEFLSRYLEVDIEGFFDNIDQQILMHLLEKKVDDVKFLNVIRKMLKAGYLEDWKFHHTWSGTPQGGIITLPLPIRRTKSPKAEFPGGVSFGSTVL